MRTPPLIDLPPAFARAANFVLFQLGWFACVLGAASGHAWAGTAAVAAIAAWHLCTVTSPGAEARLLTAVLIVGALWESALAATGWLAYRPGAALAWLAPHWILALWILFATTLNVSLAWMKSRPWLAALFGAAGGPLSFAAGARLGAVELVEPTLALAALAVGWGLMMPLLMALARRCGGTPEQAGLARSAL